MSEATEVLHGLLAVAALKHVPRVVHVIGARRVLHGLLAVAALKHAYPRFSNASSLFSTAFWLWPH